MLRRDAENNYLKDLLKGSHDQKGLKKQLDDTILQLEDDFNFIALCNKGSEFMTQEKVQRIKEIGSRKWFRHFDDRIGLSSEETLRKEALPARPLPAEESLLDDRPDHIIPRTSGMDIYGPENSYGIKMNIPENLYNLGEIYNLSVQKGTLTNEERFKINEHIIQTIVMLSQLPFPKYLAKVEEYAGSHHETLIGTGYPRNLQAADMSVPARIIVIADIFEALTASDRPYKEAKTLSQAFRIMDSMRRDHHIDSDLFELFLTSGLYRQYAENHLNPEQIDEVDISLFLNKLEK